MKQHLRIFNWLPLMAIAVLAIVIVQGCIKKDDIDFNKLAEVQWSPDMAIPLVNSSLTAADIITKGDRDGRIQIDSATKFCTLVYEGDLFSKDAESTFKIADQDFQQSFNVPAPAVAALIAGSSASFSNNQTFTFNGNGVAIDSVLMKGGAATIHLTSSVQQTTTITVQMPAVTVNGVPFSKTATLNAANSWVNDINFNLDNYKFDLTNGGSQTNTLAVNVTVVITKDGPTLPTTGDNISYDFKLTLPKFRRIHGDMGSNITLSTGLGDTVRYSAFKNSLYTGHINYFDPKLIIKIENSYGIPADVDVLLAKANIAAPNPGAGDYPVTGSGISNTINIGAPTLAQIGQTIFSQRQVDKTNSNVDQVLNLNPEYFIYNLKFTGNPGGTPATRNFVLDTSKLVARVRSEMPLYGTATGFSLLKEFDFEFKDTGYVDYVTIRTHILNGFPLDVNSQIYFVDANHNYVDSLALTPAQRVSTKAGLIDANGKVITKTLAINDYKIDHLRWQKIGKTAKYIDLVANIESKPNSQNVKIYSNYTLDVRLGIRAKLDVNIKTIK